MPSTEDDGKSITCRAENPKVTGLYLETTWKLDVVCEYTMHYYLCRQSILSLVYIFYGYFIAIRSIHSKHIGCADLFTIAAATVSDCDIPLNLNNDNRFCISTAPINYTKTSYWLILEFSCFSFFARSSEHGCDKQNDVIRTYREQNSKIRLLFFQKPRSRAN